MLSEWRLLHSSALHVCYGALAYRTWYSLLTCTVSHGRISIFLRALRGTPRMGSSTALYSFHCTMGAPKGTMRQAPAKRSALPMKGPDPRGKKYGTALC